MSRYAPFATSCLLLATVDIAHGPIGSQLVGLSPQAKPSFDVVSIKPNTTGVLPIGPPEERPDGGFRVTSTSVLALLNRAYPGLQKVGLPSWATTERYDVSVTSSLTRPTADTRAAMVRTMLADRFHLVAHVEKSEQPVYDLVLARSDGRLGPGIQPTTTDCARIASGRAAEAAGTAPTLPQRPDFSAPPPPCTLRAVAALLRDRQGDRQGALGDLLEGEATMDTLASVLRLAGRVVIDKTGLPGSYRVKMNFDRRSGRGLDVLPSTSATAPSVFTAVQEQLGLKLQPSHAEQERLMIDRLDRPTED